jgi:hypothetical protein
MEETVGQGNLDVQKQVNENLETETKDNILLAYAATVWWPRVTQNKQS